MSAQTDTYVQEAACINACIPRGDQLAVLIYLFAQIAGVTTDPNTLMQQAACINNCIPMGMQLPVLVYLASQITSGGGSGTANVISTVDPVNGTTAGVQGQFWWNKSAQKLWINQDGTNSGWEQLI